MNKPMKIHAFSLVEVTLAIGVVAFALLTVVALLPTGLRSVKNANDQAAAGAVLAAMSESLRNASSADGRTFQQNFAGETLTFVIGEGAPAARQWDDLTLEGATDAASKQLVARLQILETPSADGLQPGRASATVAWSAMGSPVFDPALLQWSGHEGSMSTAIQFLPVGRP